MYIGYLLSYLFIFTCFKSLTPTDICFQGALLCCLTLNYAAARPCCICWVSNANSTDPNHTAARRTVRGMYRKTKEPFDVLSGKSRRHTRQWAKGELKKISAKALRPSSWDASFGDSPWGKYAYLVCIFPVKYAYSILYVSYFRYLRCDAPGTFASI